MLRIRQEHVERGARVRTRTQNTCVRHWRGIPGRKHKWQNRNTQHRCSSLERNTWKELQVSEHHKTTQVFVTGEEHMEGSTSVRMHNTDVPSVLGVRSAHNHETHTAQFSIAQISNYTYLTELLTFYLNFREKSMCSAFVEFVRHILKVSQHCCVLIVDMQQMFHRYFCNLTLYQIPHVQHHRFIT